jgi:hypothetical protein
MTLHLVKGKCLLEVAGIQSCFTCTVIDHGLAAKMPISIKDLILIDYIDNSRGLDVGIVDNQTTIVDEGNPSKSKWIMISNTVSLIFILHVRGHLRRHRSINVTISSNVNLLYCDGNISKVKRSTLASQ